MIDSYQFGGMTIDGRNYQKDVIIMTGKVICPWWREKGHMLQPKDLVDHLAGSWPENLIVGTGQFGIMKLADDFEAWCEEKGMILFHAKTGDAVRIFNEHLEKASPCAGAFHLTC